MKTTASLVLVTLGFGVNALFAADSTAVFTLPSGVTIRIVEAPFNPAEHRIKGCGLGPIAKPDTACLIDGQPPFGWLDQGPETYVKSITASFRGRSYTLDVSHMYNAWGGRPLEVKGAVRYFGGSCSDASNCTFRGLFADGAASYVAEWLIYDGVSVRTVLTGSGDIVSQFIQHIDPPNEYD